MQKLIFGTLTAKIIPLTANHRPLDPLEDEVLLYLHIFSLIA